MEAPPMSAPPVLCDYERHPDCGVAYRDTNKSCHRPAVVKFKQTVQEMTFLEQKYGQLRSGQLCTVRYENFRSSLRLEPKYVTVR